MRGWIQLCLSCLLVSLAGIPRTGGTIIYANTTIVRAVLTATSTLTLTSSANVGAYVLQGLGGTLPSSSAVARKNSSSSTQSSSTSSQTTASTNITGSALSASGDPQVTFIGPVTTFSDADLSVSFSYASDVSGVSQAAQCWSQLSSWYVESVSWFNSVVANTTYSYTQSTTYETYLSTTTRTLYPTASVPAYTLCDGWPRVNLSVITEYTTQNVTASWSYLAPDIPITFRNQPCTPSGEDCAIFYYDSNAYDPSANTSVIMSIIGNDPLGNQTYADFNRESEDQLYRFCGFPAHLGEPCIITGGPVQLFYFPVDTVGDDLCHGNASTVVNTEPEVVSTLGREYTSGYVYLSFSTLYASYDGFWGDRVGPAFSDYVVTLKSEDISTRCDDGTTLPTQLCDVDGGTTQLNFADWNKPIRPSVYFNGKLCWVPNSDNYNPCATIWDDFNPWLAMPTIIKSQISQWSTCEFLDVMEAPLLFDPPRALKPVQSAATATVPTAPASASAAPSQTATSPQPVETRPSTSQWPTTTYTPVLWPSVAASSYTVSEEQDQTAAGSTLLSSVQASPPAAKTIAKNTILAGAASDDKVSQYPASEDPSQTTEADSKSTGDAAFPSSDPTQNGNVTPNESAPQTTGQYADPAFSSVDPGGAVVSLLGNPTATTASSVAAQLDPPNPASQIDPQDPAVSDSEGTTFAPPTTSSAPTTTNALSVLESAANGLADAEPSSDSSPTSVQADPTGPGSGSLVMSPDAGSTLPQVVQTLAVGSDTMTLISASGQYNLGDQTHALSMGGPAHTVSGHTLSAGLSGILADGSTIVTFAARLPIDSAVTRPTVVTVDSDRYTLSTVGNSRFVVNGVTASQGASAIAIDGQMISVMHSAVLIGSSTIEMQASETAVENGAMSVAGTTLSVGGPNVVSDGNTISLASGGLVLIDPQATQALSAVEGSHSFTGAASLLAAGTLTITAAAVGATFASEGQHGPNAEVTAGTQTFTVVQDPSSSNVDVVDGSILLTPDGAAQTIKGQTFSAAPSGVQVDGSRVALTHPTGSIGTGSIADGQHTVQTARTTSHAPGATTSNAPAVSSSQITAVSSACSVWVPFAGLSYIILALLGALVVQQGSI